MRGSGRSFSDMSGGGGCRVGKECSKVVVWDGLVQMCWGLLFFCVYVGLGRHVMVLWWEMAGSYPVACGLFLWESRLVPTFVVRVSFGLSVHCLNAALWGFLLSFLPEFSF